jgi:hypothetical protein
MRSFLMAVLLLIIAPLAVVAQVEPVPDSGALDMLVGMLLPVLATLGGRYAYEGIQILSNFVNVKVPAVFHAIALVVVNWLLLQLGQFIGMPLPSDLDSFTLETATATAMMLMQMGWHWISQKDKPKLSKG